MSYTVKVNGNILPEVYSDTDIRGYAPAWREYKADVRVALSGTHMYVSLAKFLGEPEPPPSPRPQPAPAYAPPVQPGYAPPVQSGYAPPHTGYAPPVQPGYAPSPGGYVQPKQFKYIPPPEDTGYQSSPMAGDSSVFKIIGYLCLFAFIGSLAMIGGFSLGPRSFAFALISFVLGLYRLAKS
jgi:hypothetical protein